MNPLLLVGLSVIGVDFVNYASGGKSFLTGKRAGVEPFEPHMMYLYVDGQLIDKQLAETYQQHLSLQSRGYVHTDRGA